MNDDKRNDAAALAQLSSPAARAEWDALTREQKDSRLAIFDQEARARDRMLMSEAAHEAQQNEWDKLCPPLYSEEINFDKLPCDQQLALMVMRWSFCPTGLLLLGPTGRGKTRLIWHVLNNAHFSGRRIIALDGIKFANDASAAAYSPEDTERWMQRMSTVDILFIDDLAKRFTKTSAQLLFGLVERRTSMRLPILITTNLTADQLSTVINDNELAEPLARRLREFCNPVTL